VFAVLAGAGLPATMEGQHALTKGDRSFDANFGVSFYTDNGPRFALLRNRKVLMLGLREEYVFSVGRRFAWASTVELPVSIILPHRGGKDAECWWRATSGNRECYEVSRPRTPVGAVGLTPLGIKLYYGPARRLRLFGALAGGFVAFDRNTPVVAASAVNFAAEYQLGVDIGVSDARALEIAWKFQHWSNANLTRFNPGLDVNLLTVGLKRRALTNQGTGYRVQGVGLGYRVGLKEPYTLTLHPTP
jgi:hypothetical protein